MFEVVLNAWNRSQVLVWEAFDYKPRWEKMDFDCEVVMR